MRVGTAIVVAAAILVVGAVSTAAILTFGPRAPLAQKSTSLHDSPTAQPSPSDQKTSSQPYPPVVIDPSLNFAGGDFVTGHAPRREGERLEHDALPLPFERFRLDARRGEFPWHLGVDNDLGGRDHAGVAYGANGGGTGGRVGVRWGW